MQIQTVKEEITFCRKLLARYWIHLKIVPMRKMPTYERTFDDVHMDGPTRTLWICSDFAREKSRASGIVTALWREVGHCVISDEECRSGYNWVDPYPKFLKRIARKRSYETGMMDSIDRVNERCAVEAQTAALLVAGVDQHRFAFVTAYVAGTYSWNAAQVSPKIQHWRQKIEKALA